MILRQVVPALGAVALLSTSALAADKDVVTISGWSDNIFSISDNDSTQDVAGTPQNEGDPTVGFTANASVKVGWTVTSRLHAKINLWVNNISGTTPAGAGTVTTATTQLQLRESFLTVDLGNDLSWTMGKYINHLGWISVEPTGLYRINGSTIGYTGALYGNDVVGTAIAFQGKNSPISGSFHVVNGYFNPTDTYNTGAGHPATTRENSDLSYGLDLIYGFGKDKASNVNLEFAFDPHGSTVGTPAVTRGGSIFQVGLNATIKQITDFTFGGEVIWREATTGKTQVGGAVVKVPGSHNETLGWMLLGNYAEKWLPCPSSLTLSLQQLTTNYRAAGGAEVETSEIAVALLTNPLTDSNFGLNAELAWGFQSPSQPVGPTGPHGTDNTITFSIEAIAVIP